jgi:F420-non-reducing hydrogenase iron-sulfur subunit
MSTFDPKIICFSCNFSWGYLSIEQKQSIDKHVSVICSGRVKNYHLLHAFEHGADGVLVLGCPDGSCHFHNGNYHTRKKFSILKKTLKDFGIEPERIRLQYHNDPDGAKIPVLIDQMKTDLQTLGPISRPS